MDLLFYDNYLFKVKRELTVEPFRRVIPNFYSIVKDSSADLGVNFNIVQNRPTIKAVCTKISNFFAYLAIFLYS